MCGWCWWHHGGLRCCQTHGGLRHSDRGTNPYHWWKHRRGHGGRGSNSPLAIQTYWLYWTDLVYTGCRHNNQIQPNNNQIKHVEIFWNWQSTDWLLPSCSMMSWVRVYPSREFSLCTVAPLAKVPPQLSGSFGTIMKWADEVRDMKARTPAKQWCLPPWKRRKRPSFWAIFFDLTPTCDNSTDLVASFALFSLLNTLEVAREDQVYHDVSTLISNATGFYRFHFLSIDFRSPQS